MIPPAQLQRLEAIVGDPGEGSPGFMDWTVGKDSLIPFFETVLLLRAGVTCVHACWSERAHEVECKGDKGSFI